jgi:acyl-coenzyme A synthetase/AMP-(fatty) acid ligase
MFMVAKILNAINRIPGIESARFPRLKFMPVSAAPISGEATLEAYEIFGDAMDQGYGQTEILPVAVGPGSQPLRLQPAAGRRGVADARGENNQSAPPTRAANSSPGPKGRMRSFWINNQATAERIVDGWVKTGDIGAATSTSIRPN